MKDYIQLGQDDTLRLGIKTAEGEDTGEYLEFMLSDIELPLRYQELVEKDEKNKKWLKNQMVIIDRREDVKGKKLLSKNEEDKIKAMNEFYKKEEEVYNMFLGENGVKKLLNGRKMGWTTLQEIDGLIEKQILPHLDLSMTNISKKIKEKYGVKKNNDEEVLR